MAIKHRIKKHIILDIILIIIILFIIVWTILSVYYRVNKTKNNTNTIKRINLSEFSNTLEIQKNGQIMSYPEVTILSETDWEIISLNVSEWDFVEEWDILMQIWNWNTEEETLETIEREIWLKYSEFYEKMDEYNAFEMQYWWEISKMEKDLLDNNTALKIATDTNDKQTIKKTEKEIQNINQKLTALKTEKDILKSKISALENEIQSANNESINLYYKFDKQAPRATISWIIWNIYVQEWDKISNWDKLFTIIDNSYSPNITVWLDFNEYILTKDLTWVMIITENDNRWNSYYNWEIYSRSPILNDEWKYTVTIKIIEDDVPDLILNDENTRISVIFSKEFSSIRIPENCFNKIWNNTWLVTLHNWNIITWKEIWIKNKWDKWINIDNITLYSLENEEKKDWIDSYVEWNSDPSLYEDKSITPNLWRYGKIAEIMCNIEQ